MDRDKVPEDQEVCLQTVNPVALPFNHSSYTMIIQETVSDFFQPSVPEFEITSRWLNCDGNGAVISGSNPGAVLLNDNVYTNGSRANDNLNIWKYSIAKNSMSPLSYPHFALDVSADCQALTTYQSQLLWIGKCNRHNNDNIKVFILEDEATDTWKEIMQDIPQLAHTRESPIINFISAASKGKYLIVVQSKEYQGMSILLFDGKEWRKRDIPISPPESAFDETDIIFHDGNIYLCTQVGFYKAYLETSLATNHLLWEDLACVPVKYHSNLTIFNGYIVVFTARPVSESYDVFGRYMYVQAYQPIEDYWLMMKKIECHLCWAIPSIVGLPGGQLLILGITPDPQAPLFNILEVTAKGKIYYVSSIIIFV